MTAAIAPVNDRFTHREATRRMRVNAGIPAMKRPEALADFGAAARRLRASNAWDEPGPGGRDETVIDVRHRSAQADARQRGALIAERASALLDVVATERNR